MTKYSMEIYDAELHCWTPVALFSDIVPHDILQKMCNTMWENVDGAGKIAVVDMDTGEVVVDVDPEACDNDCENCYNPNCDRWDNCDDDCGFDPYLGCYTDDC